MRKLHMFLVTIFLMSIDMPLLAQVTIGSGNTPNKGALLDVKEYDATNPTTDNTTATKGLMLPRVNLTEKNNLYPMFAEDADYNDSTTDKKATEDALHAALTVYNMNTDFCEEIYPGIHVWDGYQWNRLGQEYPFPSETDILIDNRNPTKPEKYKIGRFKYIAPDGRVADAGWWMLENLRADRWPDGTTEGLSKKQGDAFGDEGYDGLARFWYPMNDESEFINNPHYGYAYNWSAASRVEVTGEYPPNEMGADKQGICPDGWHIPSYEEFAYLGAVVKANPCPYAHSKIGDNNSYNMQSMGTTPNGKSRSREQGGFSADLLGAVYKDKFHYIGERAFFHISNKPQGTNSKQHMILDAGVSSLASFPAPLYYQVSVRCKKD